MARTTALAETLRRVRKARRLSQEQLADAAGISTGMVTAIETGYRSASADTLAALADALQATAAERDELERARQHDRRNTRRAVETGDEPLDAGTAAYGAQLERIRREDPATFDAIAALIRTTADRLRGGR